MDIKEEQQAPKLASVSKEELIKQLQEMQKKFNSIMDMVEVPQQNNFTVPAKMVTQPSPSNEEQENLERFKTRENGYNIDKRFYIFYRILGAIMLPVL